MVCRPLIGYLTAMFILVGRWTPGRLSDNVETGSALCEPRFWIVVATACLTMLAVSYEKSAVKSGRSLATWTTILTLAFLGYFMATAAWAPAGSLAGEKCYELALLWVMVACVGFTLQAGDAEPFRFAFWSLLVLLTGILAVSGLLKFDGSRLAVFGGGPIVFGRNMGLLILGILYLRRRIHAASGVLLFPLMGLGILLVVMSGSRGAMLAAAVAAAVYLLMERISLVRKAIIFAAVLGIVWMVLMRSSIGAHVGEMFQTRVTELTLQQKYTSGRNDLYQDALDLAADHVWLGCGVSGFRAYCGTYPHNLVLETAAETGLLGVVLLCSVLIAGGCAFRRIWRVADGATLAAFAFALVASQLSGDLFDSRGVFLFLLMALIPVRFAVVAGTSQRRLPPVHLHGLTLTPASLSQPTRRAAPQPRALRRAAVRATHASLVPQRTVNE